MTLDSLPFLASDEYKPNFLINGMMLALGSYAIPMDRRGTTSNISSVYKALRLPL